jgi:HD-GYP domain-containing protein (c-di-GMP phosphodiesterase class II)
VSDAISDLIDTGGDALRRIILAQSHDPNIYTHSLNVCVLGTALSSHLRLYASKEERRSLAQGFLLHDLGKMDISPEILLKPTKLTTREFEEIKMHPIYGYQRVKELRAISERGRRIVLEHHERCDGSGYPHGLTGDQISEVGRICAIVESYEDLTSERPYHKPVSVFQALKMMQEEGMGKYDTAVFKAFINFFRSISISSFR